MTKFLQKLLITATIVAAIIAGIFKWADTPGIAKDAKKEAEIARSEVQQVAGTLEKYIMKQEAIQEQKEKSDKEYKEMLHKWIEAVSRK